MESLEVVLGGAGGGGEGDDRVGDVSFGGDLSL